MVCDRTLGSLGDAMLHFCWFSATYSDAMKVHIVDITQSVTIDFRRDLWFSIALISGGLFS